MNFHDRLRQELRERSATIEVDGAGVDTVMATAHARLRRTRILGAATALALVVGVGGLAVALRDDSSESDEAIVSANAGNNSSDDAPVPAAEEAAAIEAEAPAPQADGAEDPASDDLATTEVNEELPTPDAATNDDSTTSTDDDGEANTEPESDDNDDDDVQGQTTAKASPQTVDMVAHNGGYVAERPGSTVWFSRDGRNWSPVADPRPKSKGTITDMATHDGVLYVAGATTAGRPWLAASTGLDAWQTITIPAPADDGSALTTITTSIYSVGVGPAGIVVTGETVVDLDVAQLVSPAAFAADTWTLGDSLGDLSKIVVYDPTTGDPTEEIDLRSAGVPDATLEMLASNEPTPFVAVGSGDTLTAVQTDLGAGTVLRNSFVRGGEFLASGFSPQFQSRIVWSSSDAKSWNQAPVSVIGTNNAQVIGEVAGNITVFTGQGPLLTVQVRQGADWREVRLSEMFGNRNDEYVLHDAVFGPGGVAAAVATVGQANDTTVYVLTSTDGLSWNVGPVSSMTITGSPIVGVNSLAVGSSDVAVNYERSNGSHETVVVPMGLG